MKVKELLEKLMNEDPEMDIVKCDELGCYEFQGSPNEKNVAAYKDIDFYNAGNGVEVCVDDEEAMATVTDVMGLIDPEFRPVYVV